MKSWRSSPCVSCLWLVACLVVTFMFKWNRSVSESEGRKEGEFLYSA